MINKSFWNKTSLLFGTLLLTMSGAFFAKLTVSARETDISGYGAGYSAILYDNSNGLPTSEANAVAQSADGFIWIGGYSGLIRYDGNDFYRYDSSTGITSVVALYVDLRDRLWIGTNDSGIALYEDGAFRFYGKEEGLSSVSVRSIAEDDSGNLVIATTQGLAYIDTDKELHRLEDSRINGEYVCEIKRDEDGVIYGDTLSGAFFSLENLEITAFYKGQDLGIGVVSSICPDPEKKGYIYLGTEGSELIWGNLREGMEGCETFSTAPQVNINAITPASDGDIWICADNGIGYLNGKKQYAMLPNVPMNNSVDEMLVDYEGNLWFASSRQGVMKIAGSRFTDISKIACLEQTVVNSTCMYGEELYIGTDNGLYLLDKNYQKKENTLTELLAGIRIRCIKEDSDGNLWLCSYSDYGLICYHNNDTYTIYNMDSGLKSNRIRTMTQLSDGTVAVATSGGVNLIKDGEITAVFDEEDGISNTEILSLCEGENGKLYLGSDGDGLFIVDANNVTRLGLSDGLESEVILRIKKDPSGSVYWIITSNSIACMEHERIRTISGFPYSNNFDLYFDNAGNIWVLSSNGIYVVNGAQLLADEKPEYSFYDMACGLPCVTTANSRSYLSKDGVLYLSGTSGVSSVNIHETEDKTGNVKLTVPFIEADDEVIYLKEGESVTIPSDCKRLTIYGYALTYALQNPRTAYYLEGFEEEPISVSRQEMQPVSYTNLRGGRYVYHLSIINTLTGEEENTVEVVLIKEKAFYEQGWFWLLFSAVCILLIIMSVWLYFKQKTAGLLKKHEENKTFINQMIYAFAKCIDLKDKYTNGHSFRVAKYTALIAEKMGYGKEAVEDAYNMGLLHDIGKIAIPDEILNKPSEPTDAEYAVIKEHPRHGYNILKEIEIAPRLALGAGYHHERIDGKGYPFGKTKEEIPEVVQIIAVADTFDAMNSTRPYRKKMKMEDITSELKQVSGTQLNAEIVEILLELIEEGAIV